MLADLNSRARAGRCLVKVAVIIELTLTASLRPAFAQERCGWLENPVAEGFARPLDHLGSGGPVRRRRRETAPAIAGPFRRNQRSVRIYVRLLERDFRHSRANNDARGLGADVAFVRLPRR